MAINKKCNGNYVVHIIMAVCLFHAGHTEETIRITGTITNCFNQPVADATVSLQRSNLHSISDQDGRFTLTYDNTVKKWKPPATSASEKVFISLVDDRLNIRNGTAVDVNIKIFNFLGKKLFHLTTMKHSEWHGKTPVHGNVCAVVIETSSGMIEKRLFHLPGAGSFPVYNTRNTQPKYQTTSSAHNTTGNDFLDTLLVTHPSYRNYWQVVTNTHDSVAIQFGKTTLHTSGLHVFCDDTITHCELDCDTFFYRISASDKKTSILRTCGVSTDTAWLEMKYGTKYNIEVEIFCPGNSDSTRTIRPTLKRNNDSVQIFDIAFGPVCDELQLLYPNGGEHFVVGDTVDIKWCYPDDWPYDQVSLKLYRKYGLEQVRWLSGTESIGPPKNSFLWLVEESDVDDSCIIELSEYEGFVSDYVDSIFRVTMEDE